MWISVFSRRPHLFSEEEGKKNHIYCCSKGYEGSGSFGVRCVAVGGLVCVCKACLGPEIQERWEDELSHHMM